MLTRLLGAWRWLPFLMRSGLVLAAVGGVMDVAYHLVTDAPNAAHGSVAFMSHMVTLTGMVVTMAGLVGAAFKRRAVEAEPTTKGAIR